MSRLEHDFLGELTIDDSVYYGVQTLRAMNNFHISGTRFHFLGNVWALACVKKACALANMELQVLPRDIGIAICAACDRILAGNMLDQFPVDCIQGGAGTSEKVSPAALAGTGKPTASAWDKSVTFFFISAASCAFASLASGPLGGRLPPVGPSARGKKCCAGYVYPHTAYQSATQPLKPSCQNGAGKVITTA